MLQLVPTQRPPLAVVGGLGDGTPADPLLRFAGSVTGARALVIAPNGLDLLCSLLRHGCAAATALRLAEHSEHETYDLVFAPGLVSGALIARMIYQAKRALVPTGRFLALIPASAPDHDELGTSLVRSLRLGAFAAIRTKTSNDGLLVRADLPMHGLSSTMPSLTRRHA